jgi:hypothetical protein
VADYLKVPRIPGRRHRQAEARLAEARLAEARQAEARQAEAVSRLPGGAPACPIPVAREAGGVTGQT